MSAYAGFRTSTSVTTSRSSAATSRRSAVPKSQPPLSAARRTRRALQVILHATPKVRNAYASEPAHDRLDTGHDRHGAARRVREPCVLDADPAGDDVPMNDAEEIRGGSNAASKCYSLRVRAHLPRRWATLTGDVRSSRPGKGTSRLSLSSRGPSRAQAAPGRDLECLSCARVAHEPRALTTSENNGHASHGTQPAAGIAIYAIPVVLAITLHEIRPVRGVRFVTDAYAAGRVSLNPIRTSTRPHGDIPLALRASASSSSRRSLSLGQPVTVNFANLNIPSGHAVVAQRGRAATS